MSLRSSFTCPSSTRDRLVDGGVVIQREESIASLGPWASPFRSTPINGHRQTAPACWVGAKPGSRGHHSITSSARTSSDDGTVNPSALAVLRLIASWYFIGACAGRLAGFSPFEDVSHRGVVAEQDFDDHRLDGYHSSSIHSLGIRGRALAY